MQKSKVVKLDITLAKFFAALQVLVFPWLHLKVLTYFTASLVQRQFMSLISELHKRATITEHIDIITLLESKNSSQENAFKMSSHLMTLRSWMLIRDFYMGRESFGLMYYHLLLALKDCEFKQMKVWEKFILFNRYKSLQIIMVMGTHLSFYCTYMRITELRITLSAYLTKSL